MIDISLQSGIRFPIILGSRDFSETRKNSIHRNWTNQATTSQASKKNKDAHSTINESDLDVSNERYGGDRLPSAWSLYDGWEEPENRVGPPRRTRIFWIDRLFWRFRDQRVSHLCPTSPLPYLCYRGQHQICIRFSAAKNNTDRLSVVVMSTDRSDQWKPLQFVQC